ncbi:MAG: efflux RND transporter permease subunit [Ignavibacteria bacterium]|nr:efflux RND transporter permease subunit [Ignavibacteria bacterium]
MSLTELAIKRPSFVIVIFLTLGLLAIIGYSGLKYELLPEIRTPYVTVMTPYPGASPSEVQSSVTKPIEDAISGVEKIKNITSKSYEGASVIQIEFQREADQDVAVQDVQRKVNEILYTLPKDIKTPSLSKYSLDDLPVLTLSATSNLSPKDFYTLMTDQLKPALTTREGVGQIDLIGGEIREIVVSLDLQKIISQGLNLTLITDIIKASNMDFPTGKIKREQDQQLTVRIAGKFKKVEDMNELIVGRSKQGGDIRLKDIGNVADGIKDPTQIARYNGVNSIGIQIRKQKDANAVSTCDAVKKYLPELEAQYKDINLKFAIADDQSIFTKEAANAVMHDLMLAIILVASVMFVFLHSIRTSLVVLLSIPCSLTTSFVTMWVLDYSLNLMTLLGLSLVIGILVDDSIVVIENIYHHLEKGEEKSVAALKGRNEIGFAAVSITFVDVVVFVPLALAAGLVGDIIRQFSVVILVSTLTSLFVSFTVIPSLEARFAKLEDINAKSLIAAFGRIFEKGFSKLVQIYTHILEWALAHKITVLSIAFVLLIFSIMLPLKGYIGTEFVKKTDRSEFYITTEMTPGTTIEMNSKKIQEIEYVLSQDPNVVAMLSNVGTDLDGQQSDKDAQVTVLLTPKESRKITTLDVGEQIRQRLSSMPGITTYINNVGVTGNMEQAPIIVDVLSPNPDSLQIAVDKVVQAFKMTKNVTLTRLSSVPGNPELRVNIDRQKMAAFGLLVYDVGSALQIALTGNEDSKFDDVLDQFTIRIRLDKFDRTNPEDLKHLAFINQKGDKVELQSFSEIFQSSGPTKLERKNRNSSTTVYAYIKTDAPSGSIVAEFEENLKKANLPEGTSLIFSGDQDSMSESFKSLAVALIMSIVMVYFVMVTLYDSFSYPFVVLFSIPLAVVGALFILVLTNNSINIFTLLGMIMLVGLVAKNAILLVDRANDKRRQGEPLYEAIIEAGQARIRPILMTTLAMVIGMLPIATSAAAGSEWKNGLGWALIGGLSSSMFLTLVVVPIVYFYMTKFLMWRARRKNA